MYTLFWETMFQDMKKKCSEIFVLSSIDRKYLWAFFILSLTVLILLVTVMDIFGSKGDVYAYFDFACNIFNGQMPYSDFTFEYPPFTIPFILIPRIFTSDLHTYCILFSFFAWIFLMIGAIFLFKIAKLHGSTSSRMIIFAVLTILMLSTFVVSRYDIFPTVLCIIGVYFYFQKKYDYAWIIIAVAAMTKIFPVLFIPVLLIPLFLKKDYSNFIKGILISALVALIISLPFMIADMSTAFDYMSYHFDRGLQVESFAGSFVLFVNIFNPGTATIVANFGSHNIVGSLADAITPVITYALLVAFLFFLVWFFVTLYKKRDSLDSDIMQKIAAAAGVSMLLIFLTFNKVFSAQFVIWVLMLLALVQLNVFKTGQRDRLIILAVVYGVLSRIYSSFYFSIVEDMDSIFITILFLRNIVHVIITVYLIHLLATAIKSPGPDDQKSKVEEFFKTLKVRLGL